MSTPEPKARVGRPEIGDRVEVRIPSDLLRRVDHAAADRGLKRPEWIRQALELVVTAKERLDGEVGR